VSTIELAVAVRTRGPRHAAPVRVLRAPFETAEVGRVPFAVTTLPTATDWFLREVARGRSWTVRLANAYCVALGRVDPEYAAVLTGPGVNLPDGGSVSVALRRVRSHGGAERVRGADFMRRVITRSGPIGPRHFLLGGTPELLERLVDRLLALNPDVRIAGCYAPPFAPLSADYVYDIAREVRRSNADVVWVGLGTPKQDHVAVALQELLDVSTVGVGAAFDFLAGTRREAPRWVQRGGFEWLYRMLCEPRRLGRRYLFGNVVFVWLVLVDLVGRLPRRRP
jgi:N-acetylglucosaminyldiphosphoundecaprenol N-acetyl-beta-D-mannosaminyltransferase